MASANHNTTIPRSASSDMIPRDLLIAINQDPQAVLHYILSLESEVMRLQSQLVTSREEMFTVLQISMSAVASEMTKTLSVTKNSLAGIQEKFHTIATSRTEDVGTNRPAVMKHYQEGDRSRQATHTSGSKRESSTIMSTTIFGDRSIGPLGAPHSPHADQIDSLSLSLNPNTKVGVTQRSPGKMISGSSSRFDSFTTEQTSDSLPANANKTSYFPTINSTPSPRSAQSGLQPSRSSGVQTSKYVHSVLAAPALGIRSDSQQNVGKLDSKSANDAFMAYMADSHKKPRFHQLSPRVGTVAPTDSFTMASGEFAGFYKSVATTHRPSTRLLKYDIGFLKEIGLSCRSQPNPFLGNRDEELKPVLDWQAVDKYSSAFGLTRLRFSQPGGRPRGNV